MAKEGYFKKGGMLKTNSKVKSLENFVTN